MKYILYGVCTTFVLGAVVIAVYYYFYIKPSAATKLPKQQTAINSSNNPSWFTKLDSQQRYLLITNSAEMTQQQKNISVTVVRKFAINGKDLAIGKECEPTPFALGLTNGSSFTITNKDSTT